MPRKSTIAACSYGRRADWAASQLDSLALSDVPNVALCLCAQEEGILLHVVRYEALVAPRIGTQPFLSNQSFTTWGSGDNRRQYTVHNLALIGKFVAGPIFFVSPKILLMT